MTVAALDIGALYEAHRAELLRYVLSILPRGTSDAAEDIVAETFVRALRGTYEERGATPRAWLFVIARNLALDWLRRERPAARVSLEDAEKHVSYSSVGTERHVEMMSARAGIAALPTNHRASLTDRYLLGLSYHDLAERWGVPIGTVMSRLSRAKFALQVQVRRSA